jgi:integrase
VGCCQLFSRDPHAPHPHLAGGIPNRSICGQEQARIKAGVKWQERGVAFCNIYGGFFSPSHVGDLFHGLLKKSGLPHIRFHDLRYSAATILLQAKVQLKTVQELLGHSTIATTADIYSHVSLEMREEVVNKMDGFFRRLE